MHTDYSLYIGAENEDKRWRRRRPTKEQKIFVFKTELISAADICLRTLFAEFGEEAEACDGWPGEDDGVLARDVLAELLGHEAVELRLVLQGGQTVCALTLLQMDGDLQSGRTVTGHKTDIELEIFISVLKVQLSVGIYCLNSMDAAMFLLQNCDTERTCWGFFSFLSSRGEKIRKKRPRRCYNHISSCVCGSNHRYI